MDSQRHRAGCERRWTNSKRQRPRSMRGLIIDGSGSGRWRLRLVRPIGRMRRSGWPKQLCHQAGDRSRLLGKSQKLETLGHAELTRTGLVSVTARAIIRACRAFHHGGTVLHGSSDVLAINQMGGRVRHRRALPLGATRPRSRHRREHDCNRDERREHGAIQVQSGELPAISLGLAP